MRKGLEGWNVYRKEDKVIKSITDPERFDKLRKACWKQKLDAEKKSLYPIKAVEVSNIIDTEEIFSFEMPYLCAEEGYYNGFTLNDPDLIKKLELNIKVSVRNRIREFDKGFKEECRAFLQKSIDLLPGCALEEEGREISAKILAKIKQSNDEFPRGYAHGDLGYSNLFIDKSGNVFAIDYSRPVIESPLVDVVSLLLYVEVFGEVDEWQRRIPIDLVKNDLFIYEDQIDLIKDMTIFSWIPYAEDPRWIRELKQLLETI